MAVSRVVWALCASLFAASATGQSITSVSPANLAPIGSVYVTLTGTTLGGSHTSSTVFFGPTMATTTSWVSFTSVIARAASGGGKAYQVRYYDQNLGRNVILNSGVTFDGPVITNLLGQNGATSGSSTLTVSGINFAPSDLTPSASLELSVECSSTSWISTTTVACSLASYRGGMRRTAVTVAGLVGTLTGQFSFDGTRGCAAVHLGTCSIMIAARCAQLLP